MNSFFLRASSFLFALTIILSAHADILLPPQFSDNMILQRGVKNRIWGERTSNDPVWYEYEAAGSDKKVSTQEAHYKGRAWDITLPALDVTAKTAGRPATLTIWDAKKGTVAPNKVVIQN